VKRNLLSNLDETLLAMAKIEGDIWLLDQLESIQNADIWLGTNPDDVPRVLPIETVGWALIECRREDEIDEDAIACIVYGAFGWNRWGVRYDGEVIFSRYHARRGDTEKAESLGFGTW